MYKLPSAVVDLAISHAHGSRQPSTRYLHLFSRAFASHAATVQKSDTRPSAQLGPQVSAPHKQRNPYILQPQRVSTRPNAAIVEVQADHQVDDEVSFSEEQLLSFYTDLMSVDSPTIPVSPSPQDVVTSLDLQASVERTLATLKSFPNCADFSPAPWLADFLDSEALHRQLLAHLDRVLPQLRRDTTEVTHGFPVLSNPAEAMSSLDFKAEMETLFQLLVADEDILALEIFAALCPRTGVNLTEEHLTAILSIYAEAGQPECFENFLSQYVPSDNISLTQRHLHVRSYIRALPQGHYPTAALAALHHYETINQPAPIKSYNSLISALFRVQEDPALARGRAWDLFAHMRYVAHPNPDVQMYTTMIRACASPLSSAKYQSEPERALDLWHEMTVDHKIQPTAGAYDAIILACTKSGERLFVDHGFKLVREMVDGHRDAFGRSAFYPSRRTFHAMLEGLKRIGDLGRVRWILAEMARIVASRNPTPNEAKSEYDIDEQTLAHVFHAYAAYKPPLPLSRLKNASPQMNASSDPQPVESDIPEPANSEEGAASLHDTSTPLESHTSAPFSEAALVTSNGGRTFEHHLFANAPHIAPQTSQEILAEARLLFERVLSSKDRLSGPEMNDNDSDCKPSKLDLIFRHVELTPRLLNSLLYVHYAHSTDIYAIREVFGRIYSPVQAQDNLNLTPDPHAIVDALERCALQSQKSRRLAHQQRQDGLSVALMWAEELWTLWQRDFEPHLSQGLFSENPVDTARRIHTQDARLIERAWIAWIKTLTMSYRLTRAMRQVQEFATRYPPSFVRHTSLSPVIRAPPGSPVLFRASEFSTRTSLRTTIPRPLLRYHAPQETPDSFVPPMLLFRDIADLHHKIATSQHERSQERIERELGFLKWVCKSYEGEVRRRRKKVLTAVVEPSKSSPTDNQSQTALDTPRTLATT